MLNEFAGRLKRFSFAILVWSLATITFAIGQQMSVSSAGGSLITLSPVTSGNLTGFSYISSSGSNQDSQNIKGSAGQIYGYHLGNIGSAPAIVKFYNKTSCTSADTPVLRVVLPGNTAGAGNNRDIVQGLAFGTAICVRMTTGLADNDTGSVASATVVINVDYF